MLRVDHRPRDRDPGQRTDLISIGDVPEVSEVPPTRNLREHTEPLVATGQPVPSGHQEGVSAVDVRLDLHGGSRRDDRHLATILLLSPERRAIRTFAVGTSMS